MLLGRAGLLIFHRSFRGVFSMNAQSPFSFLLRCNRARAEHSSSWFYPGLKPASNSGLIILGPTRRSRVHARTREPVIYPNGTLIHTLQ